MEVLGGWVFLMSEVPLYLPAEPTAGLPPPRAIITHNVKDKLTIVCGN